LFMMSKMRLGLGRKRGELRRLGNLGNRY